MIVIAVLFAVPSGITKEPMNSVSVPFSPTLYLSVTGGTSVRVLLLGLIAVAVTVTVLPAISEAGAAVTVIEGVALPIAKTYVLSAVVLSFHFVFVMSLRVTSISYLPAFICVVLSETV